MKRGTNLQEVYFQLLHRHLFVENNKYHEEQEMGPQPTHPLGLKKLVYLIIDRVGLLDQLLFVYIIYAPQY